MERLRLLEEELRFDELDDYGFMWWNPLRKRKLKDLLKHLQTLEKEVQDKKLSELEEFLKTLLKHYDHPEDPKAQEWVRKLGSVLSVREVNKRIEEIIHLVDSVSKHKTKQSLKYLLVQGALVQAAHIAERVIIDVKKEGIHGRSKYAGNLEGGSDSDIVTVADTRTEKALKKFFAEHAPSFNFIGEEFGGTYNGNGKVILVDPLDCTAEFRKGNPRYGPIIAMYVDGKCVAGVEYNIQKRIMYVGTEKEGFHRYGPKEKLVKDTIYSHQGSAAKAVNPQIAADLRAAFPDHNIVLRVPDVINRGRVYEGKWAVFLHTGLARHDLGAAPILGRLTNTLVTDHRGRPFEPWNPYEELEKYATKKKSVIYSYICLIAKPEYHKKMLEILAKYGDVLDDIQDVRITSHSTSENVYSKITDLISRKMQEHGVPIVVGIGGVGASGKTTLVLELMKRFPKEDIGLLNLDGYYKDINYRRKMGWTGANLNSVKTDLLKKHLRLIKEGKSFEVPQDVVNKEQHLYEKTYQPKKINLIDGLSCMMDPFIEYYDVKIFITCPDDLQMDRRMQRDAKVRRRSLDEIKQIFEHRNREFKQYILPNQKHANIVLNAKRDGFRIVKSV